MVVVIALGGNYCCSVSGYSRNLFRKDLGVGSGVRFPSDDFWAHSQVAKDDRLKICSRRSSPVQIRLCPFHDLRMKNYLSE